jgi:preprotein translocase subunit SecY
MQIIFAQAIMTIPVMIYSSATDPADQGGAIQRTLGDVYGLSYNLLLCVLIIVFTYFYTAIMINPSKIADDLKRSGGFIPGVRPGEETAEHIDSIVTRITFPGSLFLALIAVLPAIAKLAGVNDGFAMFFGGTYLVLLVLLPLVIYGVHSAEESVCVASPDEMTAFKTKMMKELQEKQEAEEKNEKKK